MSEPTYVSASQLETFNQCARKWAFDKLDRIERKQHAGALESEKLHAECEEYHKTGVFPVSSAAQTAARLAPKPSETVLVEQGFEWQLEEGIIFTGFIDVLDITDPKHIQIWDYKFYRDLRYAKTSSEDLTKDIQRIVYTHILFQEFPEAETVSFGLIQVAKRPPYKVATINYRSERFMAKEHFNKAITLANGIRGHRLYSSRAHDVQPSASDAPCVAYGGCPYLSICEGRPEQTPESFIANLFPTTTKEETDMSFLKNIKKPSAPAAAPVAAPPPPPAPAAAPPKLAVLRKFVAPAPPPPPPVEEEVVEEVVEEAVVEEVEEAPPPPPPPAAKVHKGRAKGTPDKKPRNAGVRKTNKLLTEIRDLLKYALIQSEMLAEDADTTPEDETDEDGDDEA